MKERLNIPAEFAELLHYDADTGRLTWRKRMSRKLLAGSAAGCMSHAGYIHIGLRGRSYEAHRVIWFLVTGEQPPVCIDHRDGDRGNNRWANLRAATHSENSANRASTAGKYPRGVSKSWSRFSATIKIDGKARYLGTFDTPDLAHAAFCEATRAHRGEFARTDKLSLIEE